MRLELDFSIWVRSPLQTNPAPAQQQERQIDRSFWARKHIIRDDRTTVLPFWQKTRQNSPADTQRDRLTYFSAKLNQPVFNPAKNP